MSKSYNITGFCKEDIVQAFRDVADDENSIEILMIEKKIKKLKDGDMNWIARKMADNYCNCCFWVSLRDIMESFYLKENDTR